MGQAPGIHDGHVEVAGVESIDQGPLVVRLEEVDFEAELRAARRDPGVDLVERLPPVDLGFARPEEVQIGSLEDQDAGHRPPPTAIGSSSPPATSRTTASAMSSRTTWP